MKCIKCGASKSYESGSYIKCKGCDAILEDKEGYGY